MSNGPFDYIPAFVIIFIIFVIIMVYFGGITFEGC